MPASAASSAPATTSSGARSPPSASTATRVKALGGGRAQRLDLAAGVRLAIRAHAMRLLRPSALRARVDARRLELVRRAALVAARLRRFLLGDGHRAASIATALLPRLYRSLPLSSPGVARREPARRESVPRQRAKEETACTRSQQSSEASC